MGTALAILALAINALTIRAQIRDMRALETRRDEWRINQFIARVLERQK